MDNCCKSTKNTGPMSQAKVTAGRLGNAADKLPAGPNRQAVRSKFKKSGK